MITIPNDSPVGQIITFYSYKGGTGRTMALANISSLLAQTSIGNEKILVVDWDLDAPGLHHFFQGRFNIGNNEKGDLPENQLGLIDLFYEIKLQLEKEAEDGISNEFFDKINFKKYIADLDIPSLVLMPAGRFDDNLYSSRVNAFDWNDFFENYPFFFLEFIKYLQEKYKYILIDSRTGNTDISKICTALMPEKIVALFTPNKQSLSGVIDVIRSSVEYRKQSDDFRHLAVFPLASRIENAENKLQNEWRFGNDSGNKNGYQPLFEAVLSDAFELPDCDLTEYFDNVQIQYKPRYTYVDEIAVLAERAEERLSIARSYEMFAVRLISNKQPRESIMEGKSLDYTKELRLQGSRQIYDVFLCHNSEDKPFIKNIGEELKKQGLRPWLDEWDLRPGLPFQEQIELQMDQIKSAAVFVGENGMGPWQEMETRVLLSEFVKRKCPVIPVILSNAPKKPTLPLFLREMTWVDFRKDDPDPLGRLVWGITGKKEQQ